MNYYQQKNNQIIQELEEFYMTRMTELVDSENFGDAHSIFEEFVIDQEEPEEYMFLNYLPLQ
jgi:hypothetical protein